MTLTIAGQHKLEWSETKKLSVNDFRGTPPDPSTGQSLIINFGIEVNLKKEEIQNLQAFNKQVLNFFSPSNSWIDWTDNSRLRYAVTLFDLQEWMARELRKRLNENRNVVLSGQHQSIQEEVRKEFDKIRKDYDTDSNFGNYALGQINWETRINERLNALGDYCKTCGPKKE
ncbi:MAG: hypothetical protein JNL53_08340 [Cyclobacteriaceae bacterium]|nr:hypothetical protein [Cyclobacteriaceae bacterium]